MRKSRVVTLALLGVLLGSPAAASASQAAPVNTQPNAGGWTVQYVDAHGKVSTFPSRQPSLTAAAAVAPAVTWGACGAFDSSTKVVRTFSAGHAPMPPRFIRNPVLRCGNSSYGYFHIQADHQADWANLAAYVGSDWRSFADWAIAQSLSAPYTYCYNRTDNTANYLGLIQVKDTRGVVRGTYYPRVPVGDTTNNVVTAFPQGIPNANCG